jgi:hypothetical protein
LLFLFYFIQKKRYRFCFGLILGLLLFGAVTGSFAQSASVIYGKALNGGDKWLTLFNPFQSYQLSAPVKEFDTTVRGTSPEANGTIIKVYKGGTVTNNVVTGATLIGTGTVANGSWAVPVSAIALNDQIRATAAFTGTAPYTTNAAHNFFVEVTKLHGLAAQHLRQRDRRYRRHRPDHCPCRRRPVGVPPFLFFKRQAGEPETSASALAAASISV